LFASFLAAQYNQPFNFFFYFERMPCSSGRQRCLEVACGIHPNATLLAPACAIAKKPLHYNRSSAASKRSNRPVAVVAICSTAKDNGHKQLIHQRKGCPTKRRKRFYNQIASWVSNPIQDKELGDFYSVTKGLIGVLTCEDDVKELLTPTLINAEKYVNKVGMLQGEEDLLNLLLVSALVTSKFWGDDGTIELDTISEVSGKSKLEICGLERNFLGKIDYNLYYCNKKWTTPTPSSSSEEEPMWL